MKAEIQTGEITSTILPKSYFLPIFQLTYDEVTRQLTIFSNVGPRAALLVRIRNICEPGMAI